MDHRVTGSSVMARWYPPASRTASTPTPSTAPRPIFPTGFPNILVDYVRHEIPGIDHRVVAWRRLDAQHFHGRELHRRTRRGGQGRSGRIPARTARQIAEYRRPGSTAAAEVPWGGPTPTPRAARARARNGGAEIRLGRGKRCRPAAGAASLCNTLLAAICRRSRKSRFRGTGRSRSSGSSAPSIAALRSIPTRSMRRSPAASFSV